MPRNELELPSTKTATSNKWVASIAPTRFYNPRHVRKLEDTWNTIETNWEDFE